MSSEEPKVVPEAPAQPQPEGPAPKVKQEKPKKEPKVRQQPQIPARQVVLVENMEAEFGDLPLCNSSFITNRQFGTMADICPENDGKEVWIRARAQVVRGKGKTCFLVLRDRFDTCQACVFAASEEGALPSRAMVTYASKIPAESWVDVFGVITKVTSEITACTQKFAELSMK